MADRPDGRASDELRPVSITYDYTRHAEGSVLIECGETRVICTASVEERVPHFLRGSGMGWVTAEYGMLPRSTGTRMIREVSRGRASGRTQEIQRLIGRALRAVVDRELLGERTVWVDCDVIQADGGTRTASITGAYLALAIALEEMRREGTLPDSALLDYVVAVSVGIVDGLPALDLNYQEDSTAEVDMNIVLTGQGDFVEVQGTAEGQPFSQNQLLEMIDLVRKGAVELVSIQQETLEKRFGGTQELIRKAAQDAVSSGNA